MITRGRLSPVVLVVFTLALVAGVAFAQTRSQSWNAAELQVTSLHCSPSDPAGSEWGCSLCASVPSDAGAPLADCVTMDVRGGTNVNRLNALGASLSSRWLNRQGFAVDAGVQ